MNRLQTTILAACALLTMARIVASFFPHLRLWGLSQLHYFSLEFRIGLSVIGLLILIPRVNKIVAGVLGRVFDSIAERLKKMNRYLLYSAISLAGLVPFWLLRARTPLLGDGYMRAGEVRMEKLHSVAEPLDALLHLMVSKFFGLDAYTTYGILSCLAGGLFVLLLLLLCDHLGRSGRYEEALSCFETALNLDRKNTGAYRTLGLACLEIGKEEEARRCLEAYLKSEPEDADQIQGIIDSMGVNRQVSKPEGGAKEP